MESNNQVNGVRGGARLGAGRKKRDVELWMTARGISPATASELLNNANERKLWHRVLNSDDDRVVLSALTFLMSMRDGKPTQQINVNSQSITLHARDIESARAIIREIRGEGSPLQVDAPPPHGQPSLGIKPRHTAIATSNSNLEDSSPELNSSEQNSPELKQRKGETMLSGGEGGK